MSFVSDISMMLLAANLYLLDNSSVIKFSIFGFRWTVRNVITCLRMWYGWQVTQGKKSIVFINLDKKFKFKLRSMIEFITMKIVIFIFFISKYILLNSYNNAWMRVVLVSARIHLSSSNIPHSHFGLEIYFA